MMLLLHMLGGDKLTNEFPNGLNQEPCMEAGKLPKNGNYRKQELVLSVKLQLK